MFKVSHSYILDKLRYINWSFNSDNCSVSETNRNPVASVLIAADQSWLPCSYWKVTNGYKVALISWLRHTQSFADRGCSHLYSISHSSLFLWLPIRQTALPACGQIRLEHQCSRLMGQHGRSGVHCFHHSSRLNILSCVIMNWSRPWPWAWEAEVLLPRPVHEVAAKRLWTVSALSGQLKTWQHTRSLVLLFSLFIAASNSVFVCCIWGTTEMAN